MGHCDYYIPTSPSEVVLGHSFLTAFTKIITDIFSLADIFHVVET